MHGLGDARAFPVKKAELFLGNAGTAFRPLTAVLALSDGRYRLSGVARMHERPIGDLVTALEGAGARIEYLGNRGFPPLAVNPRGPAAAAAASVRVRGDVSSQFLSSLLIALGWSGERATIEVEGELISKPYVALTLGLMERFGVEVVREGWSEFRIAPMADMHRPAFSTSRETHRAHRISSPRAPSAAGRCASTAWDARASRETLRSRRCSSNWAPPSRCATARSKRGEARLRCARSTSTST